MTEIQIDCDGAGKVMIADEVLSTIASTAAQEIDGVAAMAGNIKGDIAQILGGRRSPTKGVVVEVDDAGSVFITLNIVVKFGHHIQEISEAVQKKVKTAIENMTGQNASEVNINVVGVLYDTPPKHKSVPTPKR
ncbi:MAG: Asp23/Gls24 family envelope stress response protein [Clostridiales bacterium]|jgi:uncharacterized alkaline shock family protein YloU|nr:Asp23/Gls24 family envelope stress response protein [Clostridiales bacterium]